MDPAFTWILTLNPSDRCPILKTWNLKGLKDITYELQLTMKKIVRQYLNDLNYGHSYEYITLTIHILMIIQYKEGNARTIPITWETDTVCCISLSLHPLIN